MYMRRLIKIAIPLGQRQAREQKLKFWRIWRESFFSDVVPAVEKYAALATHTEEGYVSSYLARLFFVGSVQPL